MKKISNVLFLSLLLTLVFSTISFSQGKRIVGIIPFDNTGSAQYAWVARGIEEILYDKFSVPEEISVYEKETLVRLLQELKVSSSADLQRRTSFAIGKKSGIEVLVVGSYRVKEGNLSVDFRLVSTYTGSDIMNRQFEGPLNQIFSLFSGVITEALNILDISLSASEKEELNAVPTKSIRAFENYCKAYVQMQQGSTMEMIAGYFKRAIQEDPDYWEAQYNLGVIYYNFDLYNKALSQFDLVITRNPEFYKPYFGKGVIYYLQGKYPAAVRELRKALEHNPQHDRSYYYLGTVYLKMDSLQAAIKALEKSVELNPNYPPAYYRLGLADIRRGWFRKAIGDLNKALELNENYALAHNALGEAFYALNMFEEAIIEFKKAIQLQPRYATAYFNLANTIYKKGALEEIVEAYWELLEGQYLASATKTSTESPLKDLQSIRETSRKKDSMQIYREMIRYYRKALTLDNKFYEAGYNLALTYENVGQLDSAIFFYRKTIAIDPDLAQAHMRLGKLYESQGQYEMALSEYKEVVAIDPSYFAYSPRLGEQYRYVNILEVVLHEYQRQLDRNPRDQKALKVVGKIFLSLGRFGQAEEYFQQLVQLNPTDRGAQKTLEEIRKKLRKL